LTIAEPPETRSVMLLAFRSTMNEASAAPAIASPETTAAASETIPFTAARTASGDARLPAIPHTGYKS
jgi:hypothetical protein